MNWTRLYIYFVSIQFVLYLLRFFYNKKGKNEWKTFFFLFKHPFLKRTICLFVSLLSYISYFCTYWIKNMNKCISLMFISLISDDSDLTSCSQCGQQDVEIFQSTEVRTMCLYINSYHCICLFSFFLLSFHPSFHLQR